MSPLYGLVLAGGRSLRMGEDKGALVIHGVNQVQHTAELLTPYVKGVYVSVRREQIGGAHLSGLHCIADRYLSPSPLNGIASAMRRHPQASWLVAAVDMPFITPHALETLMLQRDEKTVATCFESPAKGGPDPLLAIWEGHAFAMLEALVGASREHICPYKLLTQSEIKLVKGAVQAQVLRNINTPEELAGL